MRQHAKEIDAILVGSIGTYVFHGNEGENIHSTMCDHIPKCETNTEQTLEFK